MYLKVTKGESRLLLHQLISFYESESSPSFLENGTGRTTDEVTHHSSSRLNSAQHTLIIMISRGMLKTALGAIGYIISEPEASTSLQLTPLLCFHASPRCFDEYLEILLLFPNRRVVALDVPGYGISENPNRSCSIDDIADAFLEVADDLKIDKFAVVGNLMGNFIGVSLASRHPDRVTGCICSNLYYFPPATAEANAAKKAERKEGDPIPDSWALDDDGNHLVDIHNRRKWLDPELNVRVVQGELTYLVNRRRRYAQGISIEDLSEYKFEPAAKSVQCPTLCIKGVSACEFFDAIGYEGTKQFLAGVELFKNAEVAILEGEKSTINMINQIPEDFAAICTKFLTKHKL
jgi:pimeloyl-ACP methyl ester carboxylesterase